MTEGSCTLSHLLKVYKLEAGGEHIVLLLLCYKQHTFHSQDCYVQIHEL